MNINFYLKQYNEKVKDYFDYPCMVLVPDSWDDYTYKTTFKLFYYLNKGERNKVGLVKILQKDNCKTELPQQFDKLNDEEFCSVGQDVDYYYNLKEFPETKAVLDSLNDVAYNVGIRDNFEHEFAYDSSLLRFKEAQKAFAEGRKIIENIPFENAFKFTFSCKLDGAASEHKVTFDFNKETKLPNRIIALIGKNGTGKTQYLARLANSMSGINRDDGSFDIKYGPPFNKVLAISYSLFDKFRIPKKSKTFSYVYCGIRDEKGVFNEEHLINKIIHSSKRIEKNNKGSLWYKCINELINIDKVDIFIDDDSCVIELTKLTKKNGESILSSGQTIILYILTEVLANIEKESLILFDEPETHLHPNAIAQLFECLNKILNSFDSYAIIATHSPIVIQQVPSDFVYVFEREGDYPLVRKLDIECFGENLSAITQHVFETVGVKGAYKNFFEKIAQEVSYEDALEMFNGRLTLNAQVYLKGIYRRNNEKPSTD